MSRSRNRLGPRAALARMRQIAPDFDPMEQLVRFATDTLYRVDPITRLPVSVPVDQGVQFTATKELASYAYSKPKQLEVNLGEETLERQRLLASMPLSSVLGELQSIEVLEPESDG